MASSAVVAESCASPPARSPTAPPMDGSGSGMGTVLSGVADAGRAPVPHTTTATIMKATTALT